MRLTTELRQADNYYKLLLGKPADVPFTGERVIPSKVDRYLLGEHIARYALAMFYVHGKTVLDAGCGEGYGSAYLAERARYVVGVDIDGSSVHAAAKKYSRNNLLFVEHDFEGLKKLNVRGKRFQVITAFEVLEHVRDPSRFLKQLKDLLSEEGYLIISTPNAALSSPDGRVTNPFHMFELDLIQFKREIERFFGVVSVFGQSYPADARSNIRRERYASLARCIVKMDVLRLRRIFSKSVKKKVLHSFEIETAGMSRKANPSEFVFSQSEVEKAKYFVAVCGHKSRRIVENHCQAKYGTSALPKHPIHKR